MTRIRRRGSYLEKAPTTSQRILNQCPVGKIGALGGRRLASGCIEPDRADQAPETAPVAAAANTPPIGCIEPDVARTGQASPTAPVASDERKCKIPPGIMLTLDASPADATGEPHTETVS